MRFFSGLIANFYYLMLLVNSKKPRDHDLINIYYVKPFLEWVLWHELSQVLKYFCERMCALFLIIIINQIIKKIEIIILIFVLCFFIFISSSTSCIVLRNLCIFIPREKNWLKQQNVFCWVHFVVLNKIFNWSKKKKNSFVAWKKKYCWNFYKISTKFLRFYLN